MSNVKVKNRLSFQSVIDDEKDSFFYLTKQRLANDFLLVTNAIDNGRIEKIHK